MNKVIIIGRLCADPELRYTQNNTPVANYRIAVDKQMPDGSTGGDFFPCVTWRANAEFAARYLKKGAKIAIEGKLQNREYTDKSGVKRYSTEIIVERHEFCESRKKADSTASDGPADDSAADAFNYAASAAAYSELSAADGELPF